MSPKINMAIDRGICELKKFGLTEVLIHALFLCDHRIEHKTKMAIERAKYYDRLDIQQVAQEVAELYERIVQ